MAKGNKTRGKKKAKKKIEVPMPGIERRAAV
jgi:hypothetical protein